MKELIIYPIKDATVNSDKPNDNYGNSEFCFLGVSESRCIHKTYMEFDLPTFKSVKEIKKVELNIYVIKNENVNLKKNFKITRLIDSFEEDIINYNNIEITTELKAVNFNLETQLNEYIKIDITKLINSSFNKNKLILELQSNDSEVENLIAFYSKDYNEMKFYPYIRVIFLKVDDSEKSKEESNKTDKKDTNEYFRLGSRYYYKKNYEKALEYYIQLLRVFDKESLISPTLLYRSCICYIELGMYIHAHKLSNEAIKIYPEISGMYYVKGLLFMKQYELLKAKDMFEKCLEFNNRKIEINPKVDYCNHLAYYYLGEICYEAEYYEKAYEYYVKGININPRVDEPYYKIVDILLMNKKDMGFIEETIYNLKLYKSKKNVLYDLIEILINTKKYNEAYELLLRFRNKCDKVMYLKGTILMRMKEYEKAFDIFCNIKDNKKVFEDLQFNMVLCCLYLKDTEKAKEILYKISFNYTDKSLIYRLLIHSVFDKNTKITNKILQDLDKRLLTDYYDEIFMLIEKLLLTAESDIFEKCLYIINHLESDDILLKLGKIYYKHGFYHMALAEFVRSIKEFNHIDKEGLYMMKKCLIKLER